MHLSLKRHTVTTITSLRILFALFIIAAARRSEWSTALALMLIAFISDYFDGYLARRWKVVSSLGAFLDPFADKVVCLITLAVLALYVSPLYWVAFAVFALYDTYTTTLRLLLARTQSMPASRVAKWKTATLMFGLTASVVAVTISPRIPSDAGAALGALSLAIAVVLTCISASGYLRLAGRVLTGTWLEHASGVTEIDFKTWHTEYGITTVLFDVEGTLTEWHGTVVEANIISALKQAKADGIAHIGLISNMHGHAHNHARITEVARQIGAETVHLPSAHHERKPSPIMIRAALQKFDATPDHAAFVGDKLVDVMAGRRAGAKRVAWVTMLPGNDHPLDRIFYRRIERWLKWLTS